MLAAMRLAALATASVLLLPAPVLAQSGGSADAGRPLPVSHATRAQGAVRMDGRLDEPDWATATPTDGFTQIEPAEGQPATSRTEVRVLYDDAYLYVGVRMQDTVRPRARLGRRDMDPGDSDWFKVFVDSYHDHRTAFGFEVNPAGVRRDEIRTIDTDDNSWDPVWDVATSVDSAGWTAELRIPFGQLRFPRGAQQTWGLQFERVTGRTHEDVLSTFIPKSERGGVPLYGHLTGIEGVQPGRRLEILPYTLAKSSFVDPGANPFRSNPDHRAAAGVDLLYGVTSNLTLNAAFNPDFGQVEVDPAVINLGVYETFFAEKRPFFIEGSEIFDFGADGTSGGQVYYSRRIGRVPTLVPPWPASDVPDITTILGAGKLSGKAGGWSVGAIEAVTSKEEARYRTTTVPDGRFAVEPLSSYFAGRARREWRGGQSILGGILTSVNRDLASPELRNTLHAAAFAGGVDFRHEWGRRTWAAYGDGELSHVQGSTGAILATQRRSNHYFQRPDATHLGVDPAATALDGYSVNLQVRKQSGKHWRGRVGGALTSPKYEVNDLGFSYRTDRRDFQTDLTYLENRPGGFWRSWSTTASGRLERNYAWEPIQTYTTLNATGTALSYWSLTGQVSRFFEALDDRLTHGGPIAIRPARWSGLANLASDSRGAITTGLALNGDRYASGSWDWNVSVPLGVKTSPRWNLTLTPNVGRTRLVAQFVTTVPDAANTATYGRDYVFAPLDQITVGLETRLNVTFTPRLSLEAYIQPLLSSGNYGDPEQLVARRTYDFTSYAGAVPNLDNNLRSLRGNAVLRWEWRPGSTLYLAWQQQRADVSAVGDFDLARDRAALFRARPDDIFIVKASYWFNP